MSEGERKTSVDDSGGTPTGNNEPPNGTYRKDAGVDSTTSKPTKTSFQSTTSTDRLLHSTGSGLSAKTSIGAHVLHSIPPKTHQKSTRSYQPTTVSYQHTKYDKVPTQDINSFNKTFESNKKRKVPKFYKVIPESIKTDEMGIDSQSQMKQNMSQIFSSEEPIKPNKDLYSKATNDPEEPAKEKASILPQVVAAISVSVGSMIVGFVSAYTSPASVSMRNLESEYFPVSEQAVSWIGGIMPLAALLGGIIGGPLIDTLGRKTTILHTAVPFIVSALAIAFATDVAYVLVGRAIAGVCVGILSLSLPVYLGETVQPEVRGTLGLLPTALGNTGILVCFLAGKYLNWWELALLGAAIPVPFLILMTVIPETPRWHFSKGDPEKAKKSLQRLRGKAADTTLEFQEIERTIVENKKQGTESMLEDLTSAACLKPLLILIGLMFFQQMSGINAVIFYTVTIFKASFTTSKRGKGNESRDSCPAQWNSNGESENYWSVHGPTDSYSRVGSVKALAPLVTFSGITWTVHFFQDAGSSIDENLCTIIVGIVNFMSTFLATALIDKTGRKILLYVSDISMIITLGTLGTFFYFKNTGVDVTQYGWLPLVSFVVYVIGFSLGFGPIPWLMMGEILPAKVRGSAASLTTAFNWMCTFVVTKTFTDIISCLGNHGAFWMFGIICFVGCFFVYFFVPETRGRSLEDIERRFASSSGRRRRLSSIANLRPSPLSV